MTNDTDPPCPHGVGLSGWCAHCDDFDAPVSYVPRADGDELFPLATDTRLGCDDDSPLINIALRWPETGDNDGVDGGLQGPHIALVVLMSGLAAMLATLAWGPQP